MKARSKFYGIKFPAFGLETPPFRYLITNNQIKIQREFEGRWDIIDDYNDKESLMSRYLQREDNFGFDATILRMEHLLSGNINWVIDANAKVYDLSKKANFLARSVKVKALRGNVIWVDTVSYPFRLQTRVLSPTILKQYATIVYIDEVWYIQKFTTLKEKSRTRVRI